MHVFVEKAALSSDEDLKVNDKVARYMETVDAENVTKSIHNFRGIIWIGERILVREITVGDTRSLHKFAFHVDVHELFLKILALFPYDHTVLTIKPTFLSETLVDDFACFFIGSFCSL